MTKRAGESTRRMTTEVLTSTDALEALVPEWNRLADAVGAPVTGTAGDELCLVGAIWGIWASMTWAKACGGEVP